MGGPGMVGKWPWTVERTVRRVRAGWGAERVGAYTPPGHFFRSRRSNLRAGRGFGIGFLTKNVPGGGYTKCGKNWVF